MSTFNWIDFHDKLDTAIAMMIIETKKLPTKTTLMEFMEYSASKKNELAAAQKEAE